MVTSRTPLMQLVEVRIGEDLEAFLRRRYCENRWTADEIGRVTGVPGKTIWRWLRTFGLDRRSMPREVA